MEPFHPDLFLFAVGCFAGGLLIGVFIGFISGVSWLTKDRAMADPSTGCCPHHDDL
jgi:hypothetical protein